MQNKEKKQSLFQSFLPYLGNKKALLPLALLFSALAAVLNILPFYYIWQIVKAAFASKGNLANQQLFHYATMLVVISILAIISYFIALVLSHLAAFEVEIAMKKSGFERVMRMPLGFHNRYSSGKIRKVINDGATQTHSFIAHQLPDIAGTVITPIAVLAIFFVIDWRLGLAALVPILLSFVTMSTMMSKEGKELQTRYFDSLEEMSSESVEYVRSIPVVKTFGQSVKSFTRFYNSIENYKTLVMRFTELWTKPWSLYMTLIESIAFFLIPISIFLINNDGDIASILSNFILYLLVAPQINTVMMRSMYFSQEKNIAEQNINRYHQLFDYQAIEYPEQGVAFSEQSIEFKDVNFSYDGQKQVLKNISFKVEKGKTLALVGASGSGKTTIARLVARFWDVDSGQILIGKHDIKAYSKKELMANIALVFQNNQLFKTSLYQNITLGNKDITEQQIEQALEQARAKEIIEQLENGLETEIGKKGTYLSGGEKQRIALARAFIKDAPIVVLDEATAFADPENEHLIQLSLKELSAGKTTIMIAHRMTTVKDADQIAVLDDGKIVEYGNHQELMAKAGIYKKMWDEYQQAITWNIKKGA